MVAVVIGVSLVGAPVLFFVLATLHSMVRSLVATAVGFFTRDTNRRTALLTIIASVAATGWLTLFALRGVTGRWPIFG